MNHNRTPNRIFLLGGQDLEMETICGMLVEAGEIFFDKDLDWSNAKLSAYADVLAGHADAADIYGVELRQDIAAPENYHAIDHHNGRENEPASILQVATLLGLSLTREQRLIAANDSGYIPAMLALGAAAEEIAHIRRKDRAAQGVNAADEEEGQRAVAVKHEENGVVIVHTDMNRFSPITDRLFPCARLLIIAPSELLYTGVGKDRLAKIFAEEIAAGKMYHGGGENGFLGAARGAFNERELAALQQRIVAA